MARMLAQGPARRSVAESQLALIAMLREMVDQDSQFIIATHSPILMAIPGSVIYSFEEHPAAAVSSEDLESVSLMRDFLNAPGRFLGHLWG